MLIEQESSSAFRGANGRRARQGRSLACTLCTGLAKLIRGAGILLYAFCENLVP